MSFLILYPQIVWHSSLRWSLIPLSLNVIGLASNKQNMVEMMVHSFRDWTSKDLAAPSLLPLLDHLLWGQQTVMSTRTLKQPCMS